MNTYSVPSIVLSTEERRTREQDKYSSCHCVVYNVVDDKIFFIVLTSVYILYHYFA